MRPFPRLAASPPATSHADHQKSLGASMDAYYLLYAGALVFMMQAGFAMLCAGSLRMKNIKVRAAKLRLTSRARLAPMRVSPARVGASLASPARLSKSLPNLIAQAFMEWGDKRLPLPLPNHPDQPDHTLHLPRTSC